MKRNLLCLLILTSVAASSTEITATTNQNDYKVGDAVTASVAVANVTDLFAFQFDLLFDPALLSVQSVSEGGYFGANGVSFIAGTLDNKGGSVSGIADSLSGNGLGFSGSTSIVTIVFKAVGAGDGAISPTNVLLLDSNLVEIDASTTSAPITITSQTTSVPEPSFGILSFGLLSYVLLRVLFRSS